LIIQQFIETLEAMNTLVLSPSSSKLDQDTTPYYEHPDSIWILICIRIYPIVMLFYTKFIQIMVIKLMVISTITHI